MGVDNIRLAPHIQEMLLDVQNGMVDATVDTVTQTLCESLRTLQATQTAAVGQNVLVNAGMDIGEGAVVSFFSKGRLGNVCATGGKCIQWSGGKYQRCGEPLGELHSLQCTSALCTLLVSDESDRGHVYKKRQTITPIRRHISIKTGSKKYVVNNVDVNVCY
jgi:hypothetical protein